MTNPSRALADAYERLFGTPLPDSDDAEVYDFDRDELPVTDSEAEHCQRQADSRTVDLFGIGA